MSLATRKISLQLAPSDMAPEGRGSADNDLTDLTNWRDVGVIGDVSADFPGMRAEACLERFQRLAEDMAHRYIRCRAIGCSARKSFVHRVAQAAIAHQPLDHRHVLVAVILMVESSTGSMGYITLTLIIAAPCWYREKELAIMHHEHAFRKNFARTAAVEYCMLVQYNT